MRTLVMPFCAVLLLAACHDQPMAPANPARAAIMAGTSIPGEYIVVLNNNVADVAGAARALAATHGGQLQYVYSHALRGFALRMPPAAVNALRNSAGVLLVEENQVVSAIAVQTGATWGIDRVDQNDLPLSTTYVYNATGAGVNAYIIDTGVRPTHSDFGGRASIGYDAIGDGQNGNDCNGHGTHVAGTVGGTTWGVAKAVKLIGVRVLNCSGSGTNAGVIAGIDWVTANHVKPAVANMSLGGGASSTLDQAVRNSIAAGVTYGLAAGNGDFLGRPLDACTQSPARTAEGLTVGSTTINDAESSFSNYGSCVDILAPGSSITSAWYSSDVATNTISGTSMATPHVVGAAALYLETAPSATPAAVATALLNNAVLNTITLHSSSQGRTVNRFLYTGFIAGGPAPTPPAAPSALTATAISSARIDLAWTNNATDAANNEVYRCLGTGCVPTVLLTTLAASAASYTDGTVAASSSYSYQVRAVNTGGSSSSNTASATTPAAPPPPPNAAPVARFTWSCSDKNCSFDGTSSSDDSGVTGWSWAFGDNTTGSGATISHRYAARNFYNVTLTVTDAGGLTNARTCQVKANKNAAGPSSGTCAP